MAATLDKPTPRVPHWLIRTIWFGHRRLFALTGGRFGLREPKAGQWGMLRLTTTGRRSGRRRIAIVGYLETGADLAIPAMNGWMGPDPAWWLNLQANPEASVELPGGEIRRVVARAAEADERRRLWDRFVALGTSAYTNANARQRARETAIVVLAPADLSVVSRS